jgi:hypothetical protein
MKKAVLTALLLTALLPRTSSAQPPAIIDKSSGTAYISTFGTNIQAYPMLGQQGDGTVIPLHLDSDGNLIVALGPVSIGTVSQGDGNNGASPWHVKDDAWIADFDAWKSWADVALSTRASEATLSAFKLANHTDLGTINSSVGSFASQNHTDLGAVQTNQTSGSQKTQIVVGASAVDPRDRNWALSSGTDSVGSVQSGIWTTGRTWSLLNTTDSVNAVQSGTWTVQQGTPPWSVSQSGTWTTGRTWSLSSGSDSVAAVQSGTWSTRITDGTNTALVSSSGGLIISGLSAVGTSPSNNPVSVSGVDEAGLKRAFITDSSGRIELSRFSYSHITTATTTLVKSGSGSLKSICINTFVGGTTLTVYDNTAASGTQIALISAGAVGCFDYGGIGFTTGLTIVSNKASDITISYQ